MRSLPAIWKDGRIVPTQPVDWPDGTPLTVEPVEDPQAAEDTEGLLGRDPESIARWIAAFDALPAWEMSAEEEAEWQAARRETKEYTIAKMQKLFIDGRP